MAMIDFEIKEREILVICDGSLLRSIPKGLFIKRVLKLESLEELEELEAKVAFEKACVYLNVRPHLKREIEKKLLRCGLTQKALKSAIEKLEHYGYIGSLKDDELSRQYIESLFFKGNGPYLIAAKLGEKKGEKVEALVFSIITPERERERVTKLCEKLKEKKDREALRSYLFRKGFSKEVILDIVQ